MKRIKVNIFVLALILASLSACSKENVREAVEKIRAAQGYPSEPQQQPQFAPGIENNEELMRKLPLKLRLKILAQAEKNKREMGKYTDSFVCSKQPLFVDAKNIGRVTDAMILRLYNAGMKLKNFETNQVSDRFVATLPPAPFDDFRIGKSKSGFKFGEVDASEKKHTSFYLDRYVLALRKKQSDYSLSKASKKCLDSIFSKAARHLVKMGFESGEIKVKSSYDEYKRRIDMKTTLALVADNADLLTEEEKKMVARKIAENATFKDDVAYWTRYEAFKPTYQNYELVSLTDFLRSMPKEKGRKALTPLDFLHMRTRSKEVSFKVFDLLKTPALPAQVLSEFQQTGNWPKVAAYLKSSLVPQKFKSQVLFELAKLTYADPSVKSRIEQKSGLKFTQDFSQKLVKKAAEMGNPFAAFVEVRLAYYDNIIRFMPLKTDEKLLETMRDAKKQFGWRMKEASEIEKKVDYPIGNYGFSDSSNASAGNVGQDVSRSPKN